MRDELKRKAEEQKEKEEGLKYRKEVREAKRIEKQNVIKMKQSQRKAKSTKTPTEGRKINKKSNQSEENRQHVDPLIIAVTAEVHADIETTEESDILEKNQLCRPRVRKANKKFRETESVGDDEMYTCGVCVTRGKKTDEQNGILWVGCDRDVCPLGWYHYDCLSRNDQLTINMSLIISEVKWMCPVCLEEE
ncbi:inhibitor of growth protein 1-like [Mytilus trossulus]|uniref:inhibitor of growth protein 1-like n=1 Tax=Mytilus trossulus TaxID=6551 RepID=UPI003004D3AA